jgi:outer membrane protein TolC
VPAFIRPGARRGAALAVAALIAGAPRAAGAQGAAAPPADTLTLREALRATLSLSPALRAARLQVDARRGGIAVADGLRDARVVTSVASGRESTLGFAPLGDAAPPGGAATSVLATQQRSVAYRVAVEKEVGWGAVLTPELGVSQVQGVSSPLAPTNRATAGLSLVVPLAKNRGGVFTSAALRVAEYGLDAAEAELRHATARTALQAAVAFWDYAAAGERLRVFRSSEARARVLVEETTELVRGDARPASDLQQVRGNLATKRAQRVTAEQALAEARQQLGVVLGLPADEIVRLPLATLGRAAAPPAAPPAAPAAAGVPNASDAHDALADADARAAAWAAGAADALLARRPDVAAAASRRRAAEADLGAATNDLRGRLDLSLGMSYAGLDRGAGLDGFLSPLYNNVRGAAATVQLQYELPVGNAAARGRAQQAAAAYEQARTAERDVERQVTAAAAVAAAGVERGRAALADAVEAVRLARVVVDNEREKFRLGVSTQIDVLFAEDALVSALLAEIAARRGYAAAAGTLQFHTGALAGAGEDADRVAALLEAGTDGAAPTPTPAAPSRKDP